MLVNVNNNNDITESKINSSEYGGVEHFKLRWETNEICQFNDEIIKKLDNQYNQLKKQKLNKIHAQKNALADENKEEEIKNDQQDENDDNDENDKKNDENKQNKQDKQNIELENKVKRIKKMKK